MARGSLLRAPTILIIVSGCKRYGNGYGLRVGGRGGDADTPSGSVADENRRETGEDHGDNQVVAVNFGEVADQVGRGPILGKERENQEDRDGKEVVVEHSYRPLELPRNNYLSGEKCAYCQSP